MLEILFDRLSHIGEVPICNGYSDRAPHIFGFCFPLCYRCTFLILMFAIMLYLFYYKNIKLRYWLIIVLLIPMIFDGSSQTFFGILSTNFRRAITGGLFGIGLAGLITRILIYLDDKEPTRIE
ncbi:MAG: DUF2085 domain-containing protein [Erysipelotrichaceae bacterium]|nr:DUF2085 domain-containing protein [Erysipelotrichaceae bacterium]